MMAMGLGSGLESICACGWDCMLRTPVVSWSRMVASIPKSYQVDLTSRVTSPSQIAVSTFRKMNWNPSA